VAAITAHPTNAATGRAQWISLPSGGLAPTAMATEMEPDPTVRAASKDRTRAGRDTRLLTALRVRSRLSPPRWPGSVTYTRPQQRATHHPPAQSAEKYRKKPKCASLFQSFHKSVVIVKELATGAVGQLGHHVSIGSRRRRWRTRIGNPCSMDWPPWPRAVPRKRPSSGFRR
jgi:hypothetical protein